MPEYKPITPASENKLAELWKDFQEYGRRSMRNIDQTRFPLGNIPLPGGYEVNDVVRQFTDDRAKQDLQLPDDFSFAQLPHLFDAGAMAEGQVEAQNTPAGPDEPYGNLKRGMALFPWGLLGGGAAASPVRSGARTAVRAGEHAAAEGAIHGAEHPSAPMSGMDEIPTGASAAPPPFDQQVFTGPKAQFDAIDYWKSVGGKGVAKVEDMGNGIYAVVRDPAAGTPNVPAPQAPNPGPQPSPSGWNTGVANSPPPPAGGPVPPAPFMDRRGKPGRDPSGPRTPIEGLTDPEGRPLYEESTIAGIRQPGGENTPLSIPEEIEVNRQLGDFSMPSGIPGANGYVKVRNPGTMGSQAAGVPPRKPLLDIKVDANRDPQNIRDATRHEGGHAIDYWTERTMRGSGQGLKQFPIPDDVRLEFEAASGEMRPDLWAPDADKNYQRSTASLQEYRTRPDELMADGYRYYKENPEAFKAKYPEAAKYIRAMVNDDPLLSGTIQFNAKQNPVAAAIASVLGKDTTDAAATGHIIRRNLFDHSQLGQVPNVPQTDLPRYDPPRGPSKRVQALDDSKVIKKVNRYVDEGLKEGGREWYNAEPLRKAFIDQLGMEEGQKQFATYMNLVAATSPRSKVPENIRNASYYYSLLKKGLPLPEKPPVPKPYGHLAQNLHVQNAHTVAGPGWDVIKNPKPPSFGNNLMGNQRPVTVDTHNIRAWGILSGDPAWIENIAEDGVRRPRDLVAAGTKVSDLEPTDYTSKPNPNEYASLEKMQQRLANKKGLTPAQYQAALWVGAREITGMDSPPVSFLELFERRIELTAQKHGQSTTETLRKFIAGDQPLLSVAAPVPQAGEKAEEKPPPPPKKKLTLADLKDLM
jgi:hypothetical protein